MRGRGSITRRGAGMLAATGCGVALAAGVAFGGDAVSEAGAAGATPAPYKYRPQVIRTGTGPTGYKVVFKFYAPNAERVQIKGEWSFARPSELDPYTSTPGNVIQPKVHSPWEWRPGDFPMQSPNSTDPNFPVADMKESGNSGIWTYVVPLPSGTFDYGFYVDCASDTGAGCTEVPDPSNPN